MTFSTDALDEALNNKKEARENMRLQTLQAAISALDQMALKIPFDEAFLFGSIAKPYEFYDESDVDFGFTGLSDERFFEAMALLSRELNREVDIVQLEDHRLAERIKQDGVKWKKGR